MRRWLVIILIILTAVGLYLAYDRYGYLSQSVANLPPRSPVTDTAPLTLPPQESDPALDYLTLPEGFAISHYATNVPGARSLTIGDTGVVYIGTRSQGVVYALTDHDGDGRADERHVVAQGLRSPNGVAYADGDLYVAEIGRIIVFHGIDGSYGDTPDYDIVYDGLPEESHHGWRYLRVGPDGMLYVSIGAPCNVCDQGDPFASLARLNTDGSGFEVIARGIRNTVGFDWHPADNVLWFTDNGRDQMGDDVPGDELNRLRQPGDHFGFPYCHQGDVLDPQFGRGKSCSDYRAPAQILGPHVAALGIRFYRGSQFPEDYQQKAIIAEHGSWNRTVPVGYRLMTVDIQTEQASNYREFVTGWLGTDGNATGRPVDILELVDGSLLVSDDLAGAVYRITYREP